MQYLQLSGVLTGMHMQKEINIGILDHLEIMPHTYLMGNLLKQFFKLL